MTAVLAAVPRAGVRITGFFVVAEAAGNDLFVV